MDREMSESSKRGETTAGIEDKQKMIKELKGMQMYEAGMSAEEMEMIIKAVKQSTSQSLNVNSSHRNSASPELSSNYPNNQEKNDSSEENFYTPPKRNPFAKDSPNVNKNRLSINENPSEANENKRISRVNSQLRSEDKFPKWKINPLDFIANDKDAPLESRFSSSSFLSNRDNDSLKNSMNFDMAIGQLSIQLLKISESRRSEKRNQNISPWGIGIKETITDEREDEEVGNEIIGGSPSPDSNLEELPSGRKRRACVKLFTYKDEIEENNSDVDFEISEKKKKSNSLEAQKIEKNSIQREDNYNFESLLDESDEEKNLPKKKKISEQKGKKISEQKEKKISEQKGKKNEEKKISEQKGKKISEQKEIFEDSDEVTICDVESQEFDKLKKSVSEESTSSFYPRRIIPPNPGTKYSGIRARKPLHQNVQIKRKKNEENEEKTEISRTNSRGKKNEVDLNEEEISALISDDELINEEPSSSDQIVIRPARISSRLKNQCELLRAESQKAEEAEYNRRQEKKFQEEAADRLKQERVRQRVRTEAERVKAEELLEKRKLAMQEQWRRKTKAKEKEKLRLSERTELNPEGPRNSNETVEVLVESPYDTNEIEERMVDDRREENSPIEETPCPICGKKYPLTEIENHAASCEEYEAINLPESRSISPTLPTTSRILKRKNTELFECQTCSSYRAKDGRDFEEHVKTCLSRLKDGEGSSGGRSNVIISVPDSPIRSLRRTSELTDSEINYTNQFAPKTRSKANTGVKRKR